MYAFSVLQISLTTYSISQRVIFQNRELKQTDAAAANLQIPIQKAQGQVNSVGP